MVFYVSENYIQATHIVTKNTPDSRTHLQGFGEGEGDHQGMFRQKAS